MNHEFSVAEVMTTQGGTMCQYTEMTDAARKRVRAMHNWRRSQLALGNVQNGRNNYNCSQAANMYKMVSLLIIRYSVRRICVSGAATLTDCHA
ncbi:hypothetical protein Y032_0007g3499 [Ancylostoma ceylanicum]|uniref:SCP domain-containing protein n=1 Tax=Ancylostoma ceylanicum TaxID=53326 RepID=A0A016VPE9_9BILA|nr:hypothetical protein Y032_0007g3499 [Ancylostoma ceylanicum]